MAETKKRGPGRPRKVKPEPTPKQAIPEPEKLQDAVEDQPQGGHLSIAEGSGLLHRQPIHREGSCGGAQIQPLERNMGMARSHVLGS